MNNKVGEVTPGNHNGTGGNNSLAQVNVRNTATQLTDPKFQINTISHNGIDVSFAPLRGGLITQISIDGKEILFFNEETFYSEGNVRGGIPIMFPFAGPIEKTGNFPFEKFFGNTLKQHGFARNSSFSCETNESGFIMTLKSSEETKLLYNFDFKLEIICEITESGVKITQRIQNTGKEYMPVAPGLHPYFFVKNDEKDTLKISSGDVVNNDYSFCDGDTVTMLNTGEEIKIGEKLSLRFGENYKKFWIRSDPGKDFVCVEPIYGDENIIFSEPCIVKPGEIIDFTMIINK